MQKQTIATVVLAVIVVCLVWVGVDILSQPKALAFGRALPGHGTQHHLGLALLVLALVMAWFRQWLVARILRFTTVILVALALAMEPLLHVFGIPHPEGLWIPLLEGGAVATALAGYWKQVRTILDHWFQKLKERLR